MLKLSATRGGGAAPLLRANDLAARGLERNLLNVEALVGGADPGVSDNSHFDPLSHLALDHETTMYQKANVNPIETRNVPHSINSPG